MVKKPSISLHPRLAACLEAIVSAIYYFLLFGQTNGWIVLMVLMLRVVWWGLLTEFTFYPGFRSRLNHWLTLIFFNLASSGILFLASAAFTRYLVIIGSMLLTATSFFLIPAHSDVLQAVAKPERRIRWLMTIATIAGTWGIVFGLAIFQTITGWRIVAASVMALISTGLLSNWWWFEYERTERKRRFVGMFVLQLILSQVAYWIFLWPLGYLTDTFIITWLWYIIWVLIRFYFSKDGIRWTRQRWTLSLHAIAFLLMLVFVIRWR